MNHSQIWETKWIIVFSELVNDTTICLVASVEIIIRHRGVYQTCRLSEIFAISPWYMSHHIYVVIRSSCLITLWDCNSEMPSLVYQTLTWGVRYFIIFAHRIMYD